jgi:hypothetical protein
MSGERGDARAMSSGARAHRHVAVRSCPSRRRAGGLGRGFQNDTGCKRGFFARADHEPSRAIDARGPRRGKGK